MSQLPLPTIIISPPSPRALNTPAEDPLASSHASSEEVNPSPPEPRRRITFAGPKAAEASVERKPASIQFAAGTGLIARESKPSAPPLRLQKRLPSPPPPSNYEPRVSFNTSNDTEGNHFSFTLVSKHKDYVYTNRTRTFLYCTDQHPAFVNQKHASMLSRDHHTEKDYSEYALEWLVKEMVDNGDQIVCVLVMKPKKQHFSETSVEEGIYKGEARTLLDTLEKTNEGKHGKAIRLVLELVVGEVEETIQQMIQVHTPTNVIISIRNRTTSRGFLAYLGSLTGFTSNDSVSRYCLDNSPVPVIVVLDTEKGREKQGHIPPLSFDDFLPAAGGEANEGEAKAVAKAIGLNEAAWEERMKKMGQEEGAAMKGEESGKGEWEGGYEALKEDMGDLGLEEEGQERSVSEAETEESGELAEEQFEDAMEELVGQL
ncbi:hypothetical protein ACLMJK_004453 [Lecanora helva]